MLPDAWDKKLIDMRVQKLRDKDIQWADYVLLSAMNVQRRSVREVIDRCKCLGVKTVAGGPLFTTEPGRFMDIDHLVLDEAEVTLPMFLEDLQKGAAKHIYRSTGRWADMSRTPPPLWKLADIEKYHNLGIQYSRGCSYSCEFCDVTRLYGNRPRVKTKKQVINELEYLFRIGWKRDVFFVDDNFISDKKYLKQDILPAIVEWMKEKEYPFKFITQVSIDLSGDEKLMDLMAEAGYTTLFIGIESPHSPHKESLLGSGKMQNAKCDLAGAVRKIQKKGMIVFGAFIVGFDNDPETIFDDIISFIQESGILIAQVSVLAPLEGTRLYERLKEEKRLLSVPVTGYFWDGAFSFLPRMDRWKLHQGYVKILKTIYSPKMYYRRLRTFLKEYDAVLPGEGGSVKNISFRDLIISIKTMFLLGILGEERIRYWKIITYCLFGKPRLLLVVFRYLIMWMHCGKMSREIAAKYPK